MSYLYQYLQCSYSFKIKYCDKCWKNVWITLTIYIIKMLYYKCFFLLLVEKSLLCEIKNHGVHLSLYPGTVIDAIIHFNEVLMHLNAGNVLICWMHSLFFSWHNISKERAASFFLCLAIPSGESLQHDFWLSWVLSHVLCLWKVSKLFTSVLSTNSAVSYFACLLVICLKQNIM